MEIDKDEDWRNSPGTSKSMTQINPPIQVGSDLCFLCCKNKITSECTEAVLEMQGIPNTTEDKLNILKVICQLLRVRWELLESLLSSHPVNLPFCLGCCKFIIEIIFLREQLFQIESEIRDRIQNIESSLAQSMGPSNPSQIQESDEEFEVKMEQPESYEECRGLFQKEIMTEYYNKQMLERKIQEMNVVRNSQSAVEFHPSLVQLHLQKNVFQIVGRGSELKDVENHIADIKEFSSEKFPDQFELSLESTGPYDLPAPEQKAVAEGLVSKFSEDATEEFELGLVSQSEDGGEISDDSDYGSPSKLIKLQHGTGAADSSPYKPEVPVGFVGTQDVSDSGDSSSDGEESEFLASSGSDQSSNDEEGSDDDSGDRRRMPTVLPNTTRMLPTKNTRKGSTKTVYAKRKNEIISKCIPLQQEMGTFKAKDGSIWTTQAPPKNTRTRAYNILRENGGIVGAAKDPKLSPVQLFKLMITPAIVDTIVKYTNQYAETVKPTEEWKPVTSEEIYAYIGMLLYLGVEKKRHSPLLGLWKSDPKYLVPCIVATMPRHRFHEISRFLRFDDRLARQNTEGNGNVQSKLDYISEVFDPFVKNIQTQFRPCDHLVVDEMLIRYKGSVRFRVYMKSKPGKYGMKIWAVCDATTGYVLKLAIYEGKVGEDVERELGKKVVLGLVENYFNSGRVVTTDNFFTSKALGVELMKRKMGLLGTLNKNRMDVIPEFAEGKGRELQSSMFAFQKDFTMVSYVQRKNKSVVLLSTEHHSAEVNPEVKNKPQMILDYNATKSGVDTADQMVAYFSCQRTTRRWPVKLFHAMLDIGALNAYIIWKTHKGNERKWGEDRRYFLRSLSESLMEPIIAKRSQLPNAQQLPIITRNAMEIMGFKVKAPLKSVVETLEIELRTSPSKGLCHFCPPPARSKKSSRTNCISCRKWICGDHGTRINHCPSCKFVPYMEIEVRQEKIQVVQKGVSPRISFGVEEIPDFSC